MVMVVAVSVNGQSFPVELESSSTVSDLKARIQDVIISRSSPPSRSYVLADQGGAPLDEDGKSIADCSISDGSTVFLHTAAAAAASSSSFHIRAMSLRGNRYMRLRVHSGDTIFAVKSRIEGRVGRPLPAGCVVSSASGRRLRDGHGISDGATVFLHCPPTFQTPRPPIVWAQQQTAAAEGRCFEVGIYCVFAREYTLEVRSTDTIRSVKEQIYARGHPLLPECGPLQLWFRGRELPDERAVGEFPIETHPDLEMIFEYANGFPFLF